MLTRAEEPFEDEGHELSLAGLNCLGATIRQITEETGRDLPERHAARIPTGSRPCSARFRPRWTRVWPVDAAEDC